MHFYYYSGMGIDLYDLYHDHIDENKLIANLKAFYGEEYKVDYLEDIEDSDLVEYLQEYEQKMFGETTLTYITDDIGYGTKLYYYVPSMLPYGEAPFNSKDALCKRIYYCLKPSLKDGITKEEIIAKIGQVEGHCC